MECTDATKPPTNRPGDSGRDEINVIIIFNNATDDTMLQDRFRLTVKSMMQHASVPLAIHILGDPETEVLAGNIVHENAFGKKYRFIFLDADKMVSQVQHVISPMKHHFSYHPERQHDALYLSLVLHVCLPETMHKVIVLDPDLKLKTDILKLYERFELFTDANIMGIAKETSPMYRALFWKYRAENPGTAVGGPPPDGITGFNSGVLLLNLDRMRKSEIYNSALEYQNVKALVEEFHFKGYKKDQDFYTLLSIRHGNLFHVLPCNWNRQMCGFWRGYESPDVSNAYFQCNGDACIYHGNNYSIIPDD